MMSVIEKVRGQEATYKINFLNYTWCQWAMILGLMIVIKVWVQGGGLHGY